MKRHPVYVYEDLREGHEGEITARKMIVRIPRRDR
jgi:hypothetical protein